MSSSEAILAPPRGMRDFYPEDMILRNLLFDAWRQSAMRFGFEHYDACVVESMELLRRKAGEEISEQIYTFKDKSDRDLALRPEMTPSLARMICARYGSLSFPVKWFAIAQCFRYERTTRGRKREHYQWNLDVVGDSSLSAEAEIIACAADAISQLGIPDDAYRVHFSNRRLLSELLENHRIPAERHQSVFMALDKKGKIPDDKIIELLTTDGLSKELISTITELGTISTVDDAASILKDSRGLDETRRFLENAALFGVERMLKFDLSVIRGLAYYTGIVFEAFDTGGKLRAIFGGGRYDNLLSSIGGQDTTAVGLGFGDVVICELMSELNIKPSLQRGTGIAFGFMEDAQRELSISIATALRRQGRTVHLSAKAVKPRVFFGSAGNNRACSEAVYIGPDDAASGVIRIKNLDSREETSVSIKALLQ